MYKKLKRKGLFDYVTKFILTLTKEKNYYCIYVDNQRLRYDSYQEAFKSFEFYEWYYNEKMKEGK